MNLSLRVAAAAGATVLAASAIAVAAAEPAAGAPATARVPVAALARARVHAWTGAPQSQSAYDPAADHAGSGLEKRYGVHYAAPPVRRAAAAASSEPLGLDVSSFQGNVNWGTVAANGGKFAYVKATESANYVNPYFASQYGGSAGAGLIRGAYHFAIPNASGGATQADYFIDHGGGWSADGITLPGALDIEYDPYTSSDHTNECYGLSQSSMVSWVASFVDEYRARTGRWPVIYSTTDWWTTCTGNSAAFPNDPLWIARYSSSAGTMPAGWSTYTIWQYADAGTFPGDQDIFNGTMNGLQRLAAGGGSSPSAVVDAKGTVRVYARGTGRALYEDHLDAGGSSWSGFGGMGGTWPQDATELVDAGGVVHLFAVGTTGNLYEKTLTGTTWSGWTDLGGYNQGVPTAVQDNGGTIRVFVRGGKGALWEDDLPPGGQWSGLTSRGGDWPYDASSLVTSGGFVWVFAVGTTGGLYGDELAPGGGWGGWQEIGGPSSNAGVPAAVQDHDGTIRVFVRGAGAQGLWEADQPRGGSWSAGLASHSGTWPDDVSALVTAGGYVWIFGIGTTGGLYGDELAPGGGWSGWNQLGGASSDAGVPAAVQDHSGNIRVFVRGAGANGIWEEDQPPGGSWAASLASRGFTTF